MKKRSYDEDDEIFASMRGFGKERQEEEDQVFTQEDFDKDRVFRQAEAPRSYSFLKKLWCRASKKTCTPGMTDKECLKFSRDELELRLRQAGFFKITTVPCEDLSYRQKNQAGMTASVSIAGETEFHRQTEFPFDAPVEIGYHMLKQAELGFWPQQLKNTNVCDTLAYFKHQGFGAVKSVAIPDLKMGWLKIDGQVEQVLVDGFDRFKPDSTFPVDTEIIIYYHTFKNGSR